MWRCQFVYLIFMASGRDSRICTELKTLRTYVWVNGPTRGRTTGVCLPEWKRLAGSRLGLRAAQHVPELTVCVGPPSPWVDAAELERFAAALPFYACCWPGEGADAASQPGAEPRLSSCTPARETPVAGPLVGSSEEGAPPPWCLTHSNESHRESQLITSFWWICTVA